MAYERLIVEIRRRKTRRVLLQLPEGLKIQAQEIVQALEKSGAQILLSLETCYGACDILDREAKSLGCDLIIHFGHSQILGKTQVPVIYEEHRMGFDPIPLLEKSLKGMELYKKICLLTTLQFLDSLEPVRKFLESRGKSILIGKPKIAKYPGQILGCDHSSAKACEKEADCFLFLGSGRFHPLGIAQNVDKPVLFLDFESMKLESLEKEKFRLIKIRTANLEKAKEAKNFGILVSTKQGQGSLKIAESAKKQLERKGRNAWILIAGEFTPEKLLGLKIDCLVDCACPRLAEDTSLFKKPIIRPEDVGKL
ncbi:MAG TPA: diphthamide biosynthesis enzyme Dph2 [archaeon]|jgi:2-(3-amino-3-carboxypropyl)histidine synthase|nr:diphthamide biosynthesis enzyme Dph2 [archaeon]